MLAIQASEVTVLIKLHTLVDYSRSPDTTNSPTIDPVFNLTPITNEAGQKDYAQYWSSTTLISYPSDVAAATYISFGRGMGYDRKSSEWIDVHGAGTQRSDPKVASDENVFEFGHGPQGDTVRRYNYTLCVTDGVATPSNGANPSTLVLSDVVLELPEGGDMPSGNIPTFDEAKKNKSAACYDMEGYFSEALDKNAECIFNFIGLVHYAY